jgi:hypothetical protein
MRRGASCRHDGLVFTSSSVHIEVARMRHRDLLGRAEREWLVRAAHADLASASQAAAGAVPAELVRSLRAIARGGRAFVDGARRGDRDLERPA